MFKFLPLLFSEPVSHRAGVETFLSESQRYLENSRQFRTRFASELEPLLLRNGARLGGAPPERPALLRCARSSASLRRLLDAQSAICSGVLSLRESAHQLADMEKQKMKGEGSEEVDLVNGVVYSLSAASL